MHITDTDKINTYYQALLDRNERFVGIFYVCVKTTSVFCIATCRARKPKLKNVEFYTSFKEALDNGYRPCKICRPTENANQAPPQVEKAIKLVRDNPKEKIKDHQLRELGISPEVLRRWFKHNYGLTFQAFQRMYRVNNAFQELKKGHKTTHVAYNNSYESLSGFAYTFKKLVGSSPKQIDNQRVVLVNRFTTPLGPMFVCATADGICMLEFVDRRMLETEFKDIQSLLKAHIIFGENQHTRQAQKEISEYYDGKRQSFDVKLVKLGTDFQKQVWNALLSIEYGSTRSYQQQAEMIGKPNAVRAVASANGHNRIAIIIPCHRVIGKDGSMRGYGGGIDRKKWLLSHEMNTANTKPFRLHGHSE